MDAGLARARRHARSPTASGCRSMLLITGHARWAGMVLAGYARIEREEGVDDADVARREDATVPAAHHRRRLSRAAGRDRRGRLPRCDRTRSRSTSPAASTASRPTSRGREDGAARRSLSHGASARRCRHRRRQAVPRSARGGARRRAGAARRAQGTNGRPLARPRSASTRARGDAEPAGPSGPTGHSSHTGLHASRPAP